MLEKKDFIGLFQSKAMIPDCMHNDNLEFNFFNRNGEFNINFRDENNNSTTLFVGYNIEISSSDNSDKFQIVVEELSSNHPYKNLEGKLYIKVPKPRAFKIFLNEYGWRYFEELI